MSAEMPDEGVPVSDDFQQTFEANYVSTVGNEYLADAYAAAVEFFGSDPFVLTGVRGRLGVVTYQFVAEE